MLSPGEISHLSQELRSRLTGGVITPIGPPDFPTRVDILAKKAESRGVQVPVKILEYLAEYVSSDVRRLESALDCLVARSTLLGESLQPAPGPGGPPGLAGGGQPPEHPGDPERLSAIIMG